MITAISSEILAKPYWNEIKSMSDADKHTLIQLIHSTMEDPMEDYENSVSEQEMEEFADAIPADLMQAVAEQACQDLKAGKCMSMDNVVAEIKNLRGWK